MNEQRSNDEIRLIEFLRGELSPSERQEVLDRLDRDESFRSLHQDMTNTLDAMKLSSDVEPPSGLVEATLARIDQVRRTEALLAKEESRRLAPWPTFSMKELSTIAVAVILMAVVLVPSVRQARYQARIGECASQAGQIGTAMLTYANANDDCLPAADGDRRRWLPASGQAAFSNSSALYKLVRLGYASPAVFNCPAKEGGSFVAKAGMSDFPGGRYISYSYQHTGCSSPLRRSHPAFASAPERMVILADSTPLFVSGRFRREKVMSAVSENHDSTGQNVLHFDMHVSWASQPTVGVGNDNIYLVKGIYDYRGDEAPVDPTDTFLLPTYAGK